MSRKTRGSLINPKEVTIVHAVAKTARNLFLLGEDLATRTQNAHRKVWIVDILEFQSSLMAIDLLDFCVMDNHIHQVLRSRPDVVKKWSNREVARRWLTLCPKSKKRQKVDDKVQYVPIPPKDEQIDTLAKNKKRIKKIRAQLSSISWWMRLCCQKVAQRANREDGGSKGPFWKGRFHATVIEDTSYLLGCCLYVDLNAVQAAIAQGIDDYDFTSAKIRLDMIRSKQKAKEDEQAPAANHPQRENETVPIESSPKESALQAQENAEGKDRKKKTPMSISNLSKGEFMSLVKLETASNDPQLHKDGYRCSDKGFLDYTVEEYLDALRWCIKHKLFRADATMPEDVPECLMKNSLGPELVLQQAREFGEMYRYRAGCKPDPDAQRDSSDDKASESGRSSGPEDTQAQ
jgi:REP element-mobilizing transposase RayT